MTEYNLVEKGIIANGDFHEFKMQIGGKTRLQHLILEFNVGLPADGANIVVQISTKEQGGIRNPAFGGIILFDLIKAEITTSGGYVHSNRQDYNLHGKRILDQDIKELFVGISNNSGNEASVRVELAHDNTEFE